MKSFIVLGLGRFGGSVGETLIHLKHEVLGVDNDAERIKIFSDTLTRTMEANATDEEFLREIEVEQFDAAIVGMGANFQASIMTTVMLKEQGAKKIIAKAKDDFHAKILYKVGANRVIQPEKDMGAKVAHSLATDSFFDMIEVSENYSVINIRPPDSWVGKSFAELAPNLRRGLVILAVKAEETSKILIPDHDTIFEEGDRITVMGENLVLQKLREGK